MRSQNTSLVIATFVGFLLNSQTSFAQSKKATKPAAAPAPVVAPAPAAGTPAKPASDKVDITDIEQKYWAPKDTDFSVVQNRTYAKERRYSVSLQYGPQINDANEEGNTLGLSANYFFKERWGVELSYLKANMHENDSTRKLGEFGGGIKPDHARFQGYKGIGLNWVPIYAKMSFLNSKIIYFDFAVTPHLGMVDYDQTRDPRKGNVTRKSALSYGVDLTQYYFFSNHFAFRADFKNKWYKEDVSSYTTGAGVSSRNTRITTILLGATFFF